MISYNELINSIKYAAVQPFIGSKQKPLMKRGVVTAFLLFVAPWRSKDYHCAPLHWTRGTLSLIAITLILPFDWWLLLHGRGSPLSHHILLFRLIVVSLFKLNSTEERIWGEVNPSPPHLPPTKQSVNGPLFGCMFGRSAPRLTQTSNVVLKSYPKTII